VNLENTILADRNQKAGKKLIIGKLFYFYDRKEYFVIDIGTRIIIVQIKLHFFLVFPQVYSF
jgi:hypothetical protein